MQLNHIRIDPPELFCNFVSSFSGCSAGNINSPIWLCGLEHGGGFSETEPITENWLREATTPFESLHIANGQKFMDSFFAPRSPFCHGVVRSLTMLKLGDIPSDFQTETSWLESKGIIGANGLALVLNAFPVSMKSRSVSDKAWAQDYKVHLNNGQIVPLNEWSTIPYFWIYKKWAIEQRRVIFSKTRELKAPKLILCSGSNEVMLFFELFSARLSNSTVLCDPDNEVPPTFVSCIQNGGNKPDTLIAVVPFFGYQKYTLNSYERYRRVIGAVRTLCIEKFGEKWLD